MVAFHQPIDPAVPSQASDALQQARSRHADATTAVQALGALLIQLEQHIATLEAAIKARQL